MTANAKNRSVIRKAIATGLSAALVGTGKPCSEVVSAQKKVIDKTPLVEVLSSGSSRSVKGLGTQKFSNLFDYEVHILVRDTDDTGLNEEQREDRLDLIEKMLADWVAENQSTTDWDRLTFSGDRGKNDIAEKTRIVKVIYDKPYLLEIIQLEAFVND